MQILRNLLIALLLLLAGLNGLAAARLTVEAGDFDRDNAIVTATVPRDSFAGLSMSEAHDLVKSDLSRREGLAATATLCLKAVDGKTIPIEAERATNITFIVPHLAKRAKATYDLSVCPAASQQIGIARDGSELNISLWRDVREKPVIAPLLEYQAEPAKLPRENIRELFTRGGYIRRIFSPAGKVVTDDFPPNHIHHHGVWWAWTKTEFQGRHPDFWNMGDGKGRVEFVSLGQTRSGPVYASFSAKHRFVDLTAPTPVVALNEEWQVKVYNTLDPKHGWIFDLTSTQECATNAPLKLPEYRYGGIGVRGNWAWNGKKNISWLTSEGEVTSDQGMRGRWCDMSGLIDGFRAGMTILSHPGNFRAPQPMRIHPTEPFFCFAPQEAGDMEIAPGAKYIARYRFIVHDGPPDKAFIESVWNDYAHPPQVAVSAQ